MSLTKIFLIWILSFFVLLGILYLSYKVSYKLGIKKALYRTTYILLSLIFAFVLAPLISEYLFNLDLSKLNITLYYKDREFNTIIDYIEEVIVHNEFLNDMYKHFPSLKDLLMDFPQIILIPIIYVLLFIVFLIVWLPLYLYLSYRRKRRILYDRADNKKQRVWAGVLGVVQMLFVISVMLSPLNGISRIYRNATSDTLEKRSSLCEQNDTLEKYKVYCDIIEVYNATAFSTIGGNNSVSNIIFDSLTRISYDDEYTSLSKEASLIIKSGIVLNQSGLLNSVLDSNGNVDSLPMSLVIENKLSDSDIDIIVETLSNSKYSEDLLLELGVLINNTLNDLMQLILGDENFKVMYTLAKEDVINEIKIVLKALTVLSNGNLLNEVINVSKQIIYFVNDVPENKKNHISILNFMLDMFNSVNIDELVVFAEYLFESRIFNAMIPYLIDRGFSIFGFRFVANNGDVRAFFNYGVEFAKIVKNHQPKTFFELIKDLSEEELFRFAEMATVLTTNPEYKGFVQFMFAEIFGRLGIETYFPSQFLNIKNWYKEVYVIQEICALATKGFAGEKITFNEVKSIIEEYRYSETVEIMFDLVKNNMQFFLREFILLMDK